MRAAVVLVLAVTFLGAIFQPAGAQSGFSSAEYQRFLEENRDRSAERILETYGPQAQFYKGRTDGWVPDDFAYLDSISLAYNLTTAELQLLEQNHFVVSERLAFPTFADALGDVFVKDLPVFVSTDMVLHALHCSYDEILKDTESSVLHPKIEAFLNALRSAYPGLVTKYGTNSALAAALGDVDLHITVAGSLLSGTTWQPQYVGSGQIAAIMGHIQALQPAALELYSNTPRIIDFSQFTVRGHYTDTPRLQRYFRAMMWLGRIEFWLTPAETDPPQTPEDLRRMALGAFMLNELIDLADARDALEEVDRFLTTLVGESDNLTPAEFAEVLGAEEIQDAGDLLDGAVLARLQEALSTSVNCGQRILSCILLMDPFAAEPAPLPVSFLLLGQRFIIDSHVLGQVVFPNILFQNQRVWRGLPDPLDAIYALGNDAALPLLRQELEFFRYGPQLAGLRYLVDAYDQAFWDASLYNSWLQAIRLLSAPAETAGLPFFMRTAAWQQEKLNTQLASWAQLRHDNLLYAKPSYTGGTTCLYPHSYVEPYPEFYRQIGCFAEDARELFASQTGAPYIAFYFERLVDVMGRLEGLARKELAGEPFVQSEIDWLRQMLYYNHECGPRFNGWFAHLFVFPDLCEIPDYVVADIHTQPTDEFGIPVGKVLHVGVGRIDLGVFLAKSPSQDYAPMAYVGPVMSYYEKTTESFQRLTDEAWTELVLTSALPTRPDWVSIYLADGAGAALPAGRELASTLYDPQSPVLDPIIPDPIEPDPAALRWGLSGLAPNPFRQGTTISYALNRPETVRLSICDAAGRVVATLVDGPQSAGEHRVLWKAQGLPSGRYYCRLQGDYRRDSSELILLR
jgi:hypothetical protein